MPRMDPLYCPFCPFENDDEFFLVQHIENFHPESGTESGDSPSKVKDSPRQELRDNARSSQSKSGEDDYVECLCGEFCLSNGQSIYFYKQLTFCIAS